MGENYYSLNVKKVLKSLKTSEKGLTKKEAEQRLDKYGINIESRKMFMNYRETKS